MEAAVQGFAPGGAIDPGGFDSQMAQLIRGAATGGQPVRVYGEMVTLARFPAAALGSFT